MGGGSEEVHGVQGWRMVPLGRVNSTDVALMPITVRRKWELCRRCLKRAWLDQLMLGVSSAPVASATLVRCALPSSKISTVSSFLLGE